MSGAWHDLDALSTTAVAELLARHERSVAIVPAGSVEAHGPHLPLGTDTLISVEVAGRAAAALAERGWLAVRFPPLHYGVTEWARAFEGTVSIPSDVALELVLHTCRAAKTIGFRAVAVTNAHLEPGHIQMLREAARRFEAEHAQPLLFVDKTRRKQAERLTDEFRSGSCHAGQYETSLVLAIRPDLVDMQLASTLPEHTVALHEKIAAGARDFAECGLDQAYCGNPAAATAREGEQTLRTLTEMVVEAVEAGR
jgi:creatinine amidohydrolase